jgi:hypothetical protein
MSDLIIKQSGVTYIKHSALFEAETQPAIMVPFYGKMLPIVVRRLTHAQIRACGDFSLIETVSDVLAKKGKMSAGQMVDYAEMQYKIVEKSLISPTYQEIMGLSKLDPLRIEAEKELDDIDEQIKKLPVGPKRAKLEKSYDVLRMETQFLLPADFIGAVISFALMVDSSDIKEVSEEMLYEAAVKATKGHDNPADHIHGEFSDFNREDINNRAWVVYFQREQEQQSQRKRRKRR